MYALEHRARVPVMLHSPRRGQLVIQRVTYQDVREAQAGGVARDVPNDTFRHCFVQCVIQRLVRVATEVSERVDFELSPKHRSKRQEPPTRLGESRDAAADDFADPRGYLEFFRTGAKSGLRNEQAHDLAHEERVSRGLGVDLRDRTCLGLNARDDRDVLRYVLLGETVESDAPCDRFSDELGKGRSKWIPDLRIDVAISGKHEQSRLGHITSEKPEEE